MRHTRAAAALVLALALAGCGEEAGAEVPAATERCGEVEFPVLQYGSHLIGDAEPPVDYSSTPPTSGWHLSGAPPIGVFAEPMSEPAQVSTLEAGGVVITHTGLDEADVAALEAAAAAQPDRIAVTPYAANADGEVVLASWGALQRCDGVDLTAVDAFVAAYGSDVTEYVDQTE